MLRTRATIAVGKAARAAARLRGGGSALPGLVVERLDPGFLTRMLADLPGGVVVVSGTNGKTTTTKMLVAVLRAHGRRVFTNPTGSNFTRGVISSMLGVLPASGRLDADTAVLELDEAHALRFADAVPPTHALLLNVARDQLDRFAEIDATAALLRRLAEQVRTAVVLNHDDSFVARIRPSIPAGVQVRWFGIDPTLVDGLPSLYEADVRDDAGVEPEPLSSGDAMLRPRLPDAFTVSFGDGVDLGPVTLAQPGLAAMINATAAVAMARVLLGDRFDIRKTEQALRELEPAFGRGEVIDADGAPLELVLVKNPAAFTVALGTYGDRPVATMVAINDNDADGEDVSWLYDVSFASLRAGGVALTSGQRAYDMALRLQYDDVPVTAVEPDLEAGLDRFLEELPGRPRRIFCTYTAMMELRRLLQTRYGLANFGE